MKQILIVFMVLLAIFFGVWGIKANNPINRPDNIQEESDTPWYEMRYNAPQPDAEWYLDPEIPLNYIPVPGEDELYMVVDDSGNIIQYRQRTQLADGSWLWEDVNPDIPKEYVKVDGLEDVYKTTNENGEEEYYQYVRNEDDSYCFVPVDATGAPLDNKTPADVIGNNYVHEKDNIYSVYNEDDVKMGYRERVKDENGNYIWIVTDKPVIDNSVGNGSGFGSNNQQNTNQESGGENIIKPSTTQQQNNDGTYTVTETTVDTMTENGYTTTYQTTIISTYKNDGTLISTKKDGPYEVSKVAVSKDTQTPDKTKISSTLDGEYTRICASVEFNTNKANEVLSKLNAERINQGLNALTMDTDSEAYKIACIRVADMAIYDHSSASPMYGTLKDLVTMYNCTSTNPSENIWKASTKDAAQIHTRFQANEGSRLVRISDNYSQVGIAIVDKDGQTYVAEIYLK